MFPVRTSFSTPHVFEDLQSGFVDVALEKDGYGGEVKIAHWTGQKGKIKISEMV